MKLDPELQALLNRAQVPNAERVRRLRETAERMRYSESEFDVNSAAHNIEWAADELAKRDGYAALSILADLCSQIAEAPERVEHLQLNVDPLQESPRFTRLELVIRMDDDEGSGSDTPTT